MTPITGPFNEGYLQAQPGTLMHAPPPITTPQPLVPTPNKSGMRPANVSMTRITGPFNANYLKPKPGSTYTAPTLTPWSEDSALKQLNEGSGGPVEEGQKDLSLEEKLRMLIDTEQNGGEERDRLRMLLREVNKINTSARRKPITSDMEQRLREIEEHVNQIIDQQDDGEPDPPPDADAGAAYADDADAPEEV